MKSLRLFVPLLLLTFLTSCVQSVQPFVKESQVTYDPNLVGAWTDAEGKTRFDVAAADDTNRAYAVTMTDADDKVGHFLVTLATVHDRLIVDIAPAEPKLDASDTYKSYLLPLHSFMLLDRTPPSLRLTPLDYDWFKKYLADHPAEVSHTMQSPDRPILTASTDELQTFLIKHLKTAGAYGDPIELKRAPTTKPTAAH